MSRILSAVFRQLSVLVDAKSIFQDSCLSALFDQPLLVDNRSSSQALTRGHLVFVQSNQIAIFNLTTRMESNNLLSFVNSASSNIQEALGKAPKRRRNVTVKKYAENRVKRLDTKKPRPGSDMTKRKLSQIKPTSAHTLPPPASSSSSSSLLQHANTWPAINIKAITTQSSFYSSSESNLCPLSRQSSPRIDPELESLLSELESGPPSLPISRHGSFESVCTAPSCTPPLSTLEAQVYIGEQAFSPYSDYSDEMDSAYCSPGNSAQVSYCCSPTNLDSMPVWCSSDLLPPLNTTCMQEVRQGMISPRCNWVSQDTAPLATANAVSSTSVYDQGPPMTPTVSQLLEQYHPY